MPETVPRSPSENSASPNKKMGNYCCFSSLFPPSKIIPSKKKHIIASPLSAQGLLLQRPQAFHDKQAQEDPSAQSSYVAESDLEWELGRDPAGLLLPPQARQRLLNPLWAAKTPGKPKQRWEPVGLRCRLLAALISAARGRATAGAASRSGEEMPREMRMCCAGGAGVRVMLLSAGQ